MGKMKGTTSRLLFCKVKDASLQQVEKLKIQLIILLACLNFFPHIARPFAQQLWFDG